VLNATAWQRMASPGALSRAHAFLEHDCAACHAAVKGPEAINCIACHTNNEPLLSRQNTAFHAEIGGCRGCHIEHMGADQRPSEMDHLMLLQLARAQLPAAAADRFAAPPTDHPHISAREATLDCARCHANQDPHRALFGNDCALCHGTTMWSIAEFRHPPAGSTDCAQCHQAPPSHYMGHFRIVSMRVAGVEHAEVFQCFACHKTNAWNDIRNFGWYKHH
jgi:hypothetical protein